MMDNEDYISKRVGNKNPFRVPDGYFDSLAERVLARMPEVGAPASVGRVRRRIVSLRTLLYAAACVCVAVCGVTLYLTKLNTVTEQPMASTTTVTSISTTNSDSFVEEVADYTMMDNTDIYAYLASE